MKCVDACSHRNVFFYDVRHCVRERLFGDKGRGKA
jgi:hypothetical protein